MPAAPPTAAAISVPQTMELLDGQFAPVAKGVADGIYALWLGSGISLTRVDGLRDLVAKVIKFLQARADPGDGARRFRRALDHVVAVARLSPDQQASIDWTIPLDSWAPETRQLLIDALLRDYSGLLDVRVDGEPPDYLLWEAVDVRHAYGDGDDPDIEHLCLAILSLEGVLPDITSANWDGLFEAAVKQLGGSLPETLHVCVRNADLREARGRTRMLKFHGCALLANLHPDTYRPLLVGRRSQIVSWPYDVGSRVMRTAMLSLATTRPTLMIGLSAQDTNIQDLFAAAKDQMCWPWPDERPAHVFAEDQLGLDQATILRVVYGEQYDAHSAEIAKSALLRAHAKPLLLALVLHVVSAKLQAFARAVHAPQLTAPDLDALAAGIVSLRDEVATAVDADRLLVLRTAVSRHGRAVALFRGEGHPAHGDSRYRPLSAVPARGVAVEPSVASNGVREMAAGLGILGNGHATNRWQVFQGPSTTGSDGALRVLSAGRETAVFFAASAEAAVRLQAEGLISTTSKDVLVVHSRERIRRQTRSPQQRYGRTGRLAHREVGMAELLEHATDFNDLAARFQQEAVL